VDLLPYVQKETRLKLIAESSFNDDAKAMLEETARETPDLSFFYSIATVTFGDPDKRISEVFGPLSRFQAAQRREEKK